MNAGSKLNDRCEVKSSLNSAYFRLGRIARFSLPQRVRFYSFFRHTVVDIIISSYLQASKNYCTIVCSVHVDQYFVPQCSKEIARLMICASSVSDLKLI